MTDQPIESYTKEDSQTSKEINELAGALSKAQGQITGAVKDSENPFFKSKYADLAAVMDACRDPLSKNNLSYVQLPGNENGIVNLVCVLVGYLLGVVSLWLALKLVGRVQYDLVNDIPILHKDDLTTEQEYTGVTDG